MIEYKVDGVTVAASNPDEAIRLYLLSTQSGAMDSWEDQWNLRVTHPDGTTQDFDVEFEFELHTRIQIIEPDE